MQHFLGIVKEANFLHIEYSLFTISPLFSSNKTLKILGFNHQVSFNPIKGKTLFLISFVGLFSFCSFHLLQFYIFVVST